MTLNDPEACGVIPRIFSVDEVEWYEDNYETLSGEQRPEFMAAWEDLSVIRAMGLSQAALRGVGKELSCASLWHDARGRPALAAKYRRLRENCRALLAEMN